MLDTDRRELRRGDDVVPMTAQAFDLLDHLIRNRDRVVSKEDLIDAVWDGRIVSDAAVTTRINAARSAIGDSGQAQRLIKTLPRKGVRFIGVVREERGAADAGSADRTPHALALPDRPSIAVLPFTNMSDDPEQEYFADAMAEEITIALGQVPRLFVIASNSAFTYKGRLVDSKQIGAELGVRYVLRGSVRRSNDRIRVIVELSDAASGNQIWADRLDGAPDDVFELQDRVAASVSARIAPKIRSADLELARRKPTHSATAYDLYLRALLALRGSLAENEDSLRLLYKAIELDPSFGAAYGLAAYRYLFQAAFGWLEPSDPRMNEGLRLAHLAAKTGRNDPEALWMAGRAVQGLAGDLEYGLALIEKSLALNPNSADAWWASGMSYAVRAKADTAIEHFGRARRLNPLSPSPSSGHAHWMGLSIAHFYGGNYEEAKTAIDKALAEWPTSPPSLRLKAAICGLLGRVEEGRRCVQQYLAVSPGSNLTAVRHLLEIRLQHNPEGVEKYIEGLRLSGLAEGAARDRT